MELATLITQEVEEVFASLGSSPEGLDSAEAARRLSHFGPNRLQERARAPLLPRLLATFTHFFALLLWGAALLAWIGHRFDPTAGLDKLAIAIVLVVLINGIFAFAQEYRAERMLAALARLLPAKARVLRAGQLEDIAVEAIVPGDVILLEAGDLVPADARLVVAHGLRVDLATLTGEARPRARSAAPAAVTTPLEAPNLVLAGTTVVAGEGRAVVFATGQHTEFGRIAALVQAEPEPRSLFLAEIARVSRWIAVLAFALGAIFLLVGLGVGLTPFAAAVFALGVIVANVPEGLLPTVTLALAMAAQRLARRGVLVRHLAAIETLGAASVIVTDKTGTLTTGEMALRIALPAGAARAVPIADLTPDDPVHRRLLEVAASCHGLIAAPNGFVGDPMERALVSAARDHGILPLPVEGTIPFDADRKRMGTIHAVGGQRLLFCKGAPETVLPRCTHRASRDGAQPLVPADREHLLAQASALAERGYRLLALAFRALKAGETPEDESALVFLGFLGLEDPPRPGAAEAVAAARRAGIRVIVATGDHPLTALALARRIGLVKSERPRVITGDRLARLSNAQLQLALDAEEILFARLAADHKLRLVRALQARGEVVAVTGDGVNDAPALKRGDIGVAMGRSGSDVAREAADIVLVDDDFAAIVAAVAEGRAVFANVRRFLTYILASNVPELVPFLLFALFGLPLPLTVAQILAVDLGTDLLPALALGAEPPAPDAMDEPPRGLDARLVDLGLVVRAYAWLGLLESVGSLCAYASVLKLGGWHWGDALSFFDPLWLQATSATFTGIVLAQMANLLVCRHERIFPFARELPRNPLILPALASEALLLFAILYTPLGQLLFGTSPPPGLAWIVAGIGALLLFIAEEGRKALSRRLEPQRRIKRRDR